MGIMSRQHRLVAVIFLLVVLQQQHLTSSAFQGQARTTIKSRTNVPPKTPINYHAARQSPLWSAAASSNHNHNNGNGNDNNRRPRKRDRIQNVLLQQKTTVLSVLQTLLAKLNIHVETARLQKSIGSFLITAAILFGLFFGQPSVPVGNHNPVVSPITTVVAKHEPAASTAATTTKATEIPYSQFMDHCCSRNLFGSKRNLPSRVQLEPGGGSRVVSFWWHGSPHYTSLLEGTTTDHLVHFLHERGIPFQAATSSSSTKSGDWSTTLVVGGIGYYMYQQGAFASLMGKGKQQKQKTTLGSKDATTKKTSFDDIEGVGNAKEAVLELVDSLRNPEKYRLVGARAPTGLLLEGPPGTGKTTLARAAASLADVPFLSASGSEFVEKYVGQGAARVRQLFDKAEKLSKKEKRPVIIFIDEIDALGKARGGGGGGGSAGGTDGSSQESEHTLIQLLASMDGLDSTSMICVLGATNRKDVLDKALVRPGRFDRIIKVDLPDAAGREGILRVHAQRLLGFWEGSGVDQSREGSFGKGNRVDLSAIAAATDSLSGAELEMIVNEAAIRAVRRVSKQLDEGIDKQAVDTTVYPRDFEASLEHFYQSRHEDKQRNKRQFGFDVELSSSAAQPTSRDLFYTAGTKRPAP